MRLLLVAASLVLAAPWAHAQSAGDPLLGRNLAATCANMKAIGKEYRSIALDDVTAKLRGLQDAILVLEKLCAQLDQPSQLGRPGQPVEKGPCRAAHAPFPALNSSM